MLADISSSGATENAVTLNIIGNVGRSSTILYRFQVLNILEKKEAGFCCFPQDFLVSSVGIYEIALGVKFTLILEKHASQKHVRGERRFNKIEI